MQKKLMRSFSLVPLLGFSFKALAFTGPTPTRATQDSGAVIVETTSNPATSNQRQSLPDYIIPEVGGNAAEASRSTSTMQYITAGINGTAAVHYGMKCVSGKYWNCFFSAMAGIGAYQSLQSARGAGAAGLQVSAFDPSMFGGYPGGGAGAGGGPDGATGGTGPNGVGGAGGSANGANGTGNGNGNGLGSTISQAVARDLALAKSALEQSGVKISPDGKTMTTPDGRKFDLTKSASSEQDLLNLGFSPSEAAAAMADSRAVAKKVNEKFKQMSQLAGAGGGFGGGSAGRGIASEGGGSDPFSGFDPYGRDRIGRNRKKAQVSGLTKKLGSDTIGVAGDDIFEMVTRRYKARDVQNDFLKD